MSVVDSLKQALPAHQIITDELRLLAYGTDASFYRLTPEVIAVVETENELKSVLSAAKANKRPVTFRAAGTSLSGQAISDGVLALIGESFSTYELNTTVRNNLVDVHVRLGSRAGLPDIERKLGVELARRYFVTHLLDECALPGGETTGLRVHDGGSLLHKTVSVVNLVRHLVIANVEMLQ